MFGNSDPLPHLLVLLEESTKHPADCDCPICPHIEAAINEHLAGGAVE